MIDKKSEKIYRIIFQIWSTLNLILIGGYIVSAQMDRGKTFAIMVNASSLLPYGLYILFHRRVKKVIQRINAEFKNINNSDFVPIKMEHRFETILGMLFLMILIIFGTYIIRVAITDVPLYYDLTWEDGPLENGSVILWLAAAFVLLINILRPNRNVLTQNYRFAYILLILFFIISAGEELSWGQRIFLEEIPDFFKKINTQKDTNIHNIGSTSFFSNSFFLFTLVFFLVIPYIAKKYPSIRNYLLYHNFPIPNRFVVMVFVVVLLIWFIIGIRFGTLGFHPFMLHHYKSQLDDEIFEFLAPYAFFVFSILESTKKIVYNKDPHIKKK